MPPNPLRFPVILQISAWSLGMPLVLFGAVFFIVDLLGLVRIIDRGGIPPAGLVVGPIFAAVGYSLLCPLLTPPQTMSARRRAALERTDGWD